MGKALVINGANFASVALDQVVFDDPIPCTSITLSQSTLTFTSFTSQTLTATVAPLDTTDIVEWTSSDQTVATVADGVVTPLKSGTTTITATCGNKTATCTVTATLSVTMNIPFTLGYLFAKNTDVISSAADNSYGATIGETSGDKYVHNSNSLLGHWVYPVPLPANCTAVNITVPNQGLKVTAQIGDTTKTSSVAGWNLYAVRIGGDDNAYDGSVPNGDRTIDITQYTGANAIALTVYKGTAGSLTQEMLNQVVVTANV